MQSKVRPQFPLLFIWQIIAKDNHAIFSLKPGVITTETNVSKRHLGDDLRYRARELTFYYYHKEYM